MEESFASRSQQVRRNSSREGSSRGIAPKLVKLNSLVKSIPKRRLDSSVVEPSTEQRPNDNEEDNDVEIIEVKVDI
ncbi:unnamed protein product [Dovyalis caffra]|uniref:Uncharacterized protein n=1 Tax=Dovyalis caffra TaxID=77055 RepID=A0AAV1S9R7_9ROSI|nr:unnamed protein product [Dovyalis caffra]